MHCGKKIKLNSIIKTKSKHKNIVIHIFIHRLCIKIQSSENNPHNKIILSEKLKIINNYVNISTIITGCSKLYQHVKKYKILT